jgi:hypothetical protein
MNLSKGDLTAESAEFAESPKIYHQDTKTQRKKGETFVMLCLRG